MPVQPTLFHFPSDVVLAQQLTANLRTKGVGVRLRECRPDGPGNARFDAAILLFSHATVKAAVSFVRSPLARGRAREGRLLTTSRGVPAAAVPSALASSWVDLSSYEDGLRELVRRSVPETDSRGGGGARTHTAKARPVAAQPAQGR